MDRLNLDGLRDNGYVVLDDALPGDLLDRLTRRVDEQARAEAESGVGFFDAGGHNQRVWCLLNKGEVFRELLGHRVLTDVLPALLGEKFLLSSMTANIAGFNGTAMLLHSDQKYVPMPQPPYPLVATAIWMLDDFTEHNGATRVVPGSHAWSCDPHPDVLPRTVPAVGRAGGVLIFDGRLWHGTGASTDRSPRRAVITHFCRPFIRQQDNFGLSLAPDVYQALTARERALLGFRPWKTLGGVEGAARGEPLPPGRSPVRALVPAGTGRRT